MNQIVETPIELSVIVVNYNSGDLLRANLESLARFVKCSFEVVVVDNQSSDDSLLNLPKLPALTVIRNGKNLGFPKACNIGVKASVGKLLHFLNPDAQVTAGIDECYRAALAAPERVFVTKILDTRMDSERSGYPLPTLGNMWRMLFDRAHVERWYLGASVVIARELFLKLGGWSEDYFIYGDDMDFFYKAAQAGVRTEVSEALVTHEQGGTTIKVWSKRQRQVRVERSALIFVRKFGLQFDYFVFRHLAFARMVWTRPLSAIFELTIYWQQLLVFFDPPGDAR